MNYDQYTGIVRAVAPALVAILALKYGPETSGLIVAALVAIGAAVWSVLNNQTGKTIK